MYSSAHSLPCANARVACDHGIEGAENMTQISQASPKAAGAAANAAADLAEESPPASNPSSGAQPGGESLNGADPLATFTALYGLHADVTRLAGREHGRENGGGAVAQRDVPPTHARVCQVASHPLGGGVDTKRAPAAAYDVAHTTRE